MESSCFLCCIAFFFVGGHCTFISLVTPLQRHSDDNPGKELYLTPLLDAGEFKEAQQQSKVVPNIGNTTSYSGFFTVNKACGSNLFFWFFPAQKNWEESPTVLWLQGGPGVPSMFGLFEEIGPFSVNEHGLNKRNYSWNAENNLLFIDQPVGTGYSFTKNNCYPGNETAVSKDLYSAVVQFYKLFPNLKNNNFFISGESFAGHYIPALGYAIHKNNPTSDVKIKLAGMMIGDGWSDPISQIDYASYLYQLGIIVDPKRDEFKKMQNSLVEEVTAERWGVAYKIYINIRSAIDKTGINEFNFLQKPNPNLLNGPWVPFIQTENTRKALHVGDRKFHGHGFTIYTSLALDMVHSVKPLIEELLEYYNIVFYNGQFDIVCAYPMTINMLRSLIWGGEEEYKSAPRNMWYMDDELAGYYKGVNHLYDVLVRNAGHMVPTDQPKWAFHLINTVTSANSSNILQGLSDSFGN